MVTPFHPCVADSSPAQHDGLSPNLASHRERCDNLHRVRREQIFREAASSCSTSALRAGSPYKPALAADVSNAVFSLTPRPTEAQSKKTYRSKYNAEMVLTGHPCFRASLFFFFWKGHPSLAAVAVPATSAARQREAWKRSIETLTRPRRTGTQTGSNVLVPSRHRLDSTRVVLVVSWVLVFCKKANGTQRSHRDNTIKKSATCTERSDTHCAILLYRL